MSKQTTTVRFEGTVISKSMGQVVLRKTDGTMHEIRTKWKYDITCRPIEPEIAKCVHCGCMMKVVEAKHANVVGYKTQCGNCSSMGPWASSRMDAIMRSNKRPGYE